MASVQKKEVQIIANGKQFGRTMRQMQGEARKLRRELRDLPKGTKAFTDKAKALKRVNKDLGKMNAQMKASHGAMQQLGHMFNPVILGAFALIAVVGNVFNTFKDFQQGASNLAAVLGTTRGEITGLTDDAKRLGAQTVFTATEVTNLQTEYAKLGFSKAEIIGVTEATLDLAAATGSELAESASVAGGTLRSFGLDVTQSQRVVDVMAKSFSSSALNMEKFSVAMGKVGPVAKGAGVGLERTTAILGLLMNNNIEASIAGTSLRRMFLNLSKAGLSWDDAMETINGSLDKNKAALEIFGVRASTAALIIAENSEELGILEGKILDFGGAAEKMANEKLSTLQGRMTLLSSAWAGFILSIEDGDGVIGNFVSGTLGFFTSALQDLSMIGNIFELAFNDISEVSEETLERLLEFGETDAGNKIADVLKEAFGSMTNKEFLEGFAQNKKLFIDTMVAEGEAAEDAAVLFEVYLKQRAVGYNNDVQVAIDAIKAKEANEKRAASAQAERERTRREAAKEQAIKDAKIENAERIKADNFYYKTLADSEKASAQLMIDMMADGLDKQIANLDAQLEEQQRSLNKKRALILENILLTDTEKNFLLDQLDEQRKLLEAQKIQEEENLKKIAEKEGFDARMAQLKEFNDGRIAANDKAGKKAIKKLQEEEDLKLKIKLAALNAINQFTDAALANRTRSQQFFFSEERLRVTEQFDAELLLLRDKLDKGILTEAEFNAQKRALDKKQALDLYNLKVAEFKSEKKIAIGKIAIDTAIGIAKVFARYVWPLSIVPAAFVAAQGAVQMGVVAIQKPPPRPQFAKGGLTDVGSFKYGGNINQPSQGIIAEAGSEWVGPNWMLNSPKFADIFSYLEGERTKGVQAFADGGNTGSQIESTSSVVSDEANKRFDSMDKKLGALVAIVSAWPTRLQVHNNVQDTVDKIQVLNDIEADSEIMRVIK